ncbi:hypothetical protein [Nonomuraea sediminis]|uniref:hypothetical protein n=1 Tax=Nonomuraea sediminis TaxID=2835864 RepID=UPI001BDC7A86|nr:hypothetical protein [Nonomuraea sediminis]
MPDWAAHGERWRLLLPPGTELVRVPDHPVLPSGKQVAVLGGRRQVRAALRRAGLHPETVYVALPSFADPVLVVPLRSPLLGWAARGVLTVPPDVTWPHPVYSLAVRLVRRLPWLLGLLARQRLVIAS